MSGKDWFSSKLEAGSSKGIFSLYAIRYTKRGYMSVTKGGITAPKGFLASGVKAGLKKSGKKDLALLYSEVPAVAACAFTTNRFEASPIKVSKVHINNKTHQAIIVNSGNANCANGRTGDRDALAMTRFIAEVMDLDKKEVLVASTGIIGRYLPVEKVRKAIPELLGALSEEGGREFAESIMTTDTVSKEVALSVRIGGATVKIGGACKGVGMIYPEMHVRKHATMLCFISTDAAISKKMLESALGEAIKDSFNMVSVDGDMSTNDFCAVIANGLAGNRIITSKGRDYGIFAAALKDAAASLAKMIAKDGEGATRLLEIEVVGAKANEDARKVARKISTSNLLKCAVHGSDPNWGRIAAAAGASGVKFDPDKADIYLGGVKVLSNGASIKNFDKVRSRKEFLRDEVHIKVDLKSGSGRSKAWTCDFSKEYVAINSEYST